MVSGRSKFAFHFCLQLSPFPHRSSYFSFFSSMIFCTHISINICLAIDLSSVSQSNLSPIYISIIYMSCKTFQSNALKNCSKMPYYFIIKLNQCTTDGPLICFQSLALTFSNEVNIYLYTWKCRINSQKWSCCLLNCFPQWLH